MNNYTFRAHDDDGNSYVLDQNKTQRGILLTLKKENIKSKRQCASHSLYFKYPTDVEWSP